MNDLFRPQPPSSPDSLRQGVLCGLSAYLVWGFFPLYFKALVEVPPFEVLLHRIVWSAAFLLILIFAVGRREALLAAFTDRRTLLTLGCTTLLLATNWLVFIHAVGAGQVLQSSLGYFINPLVSVLLGFFFLGERLRPCQKISLGLAVTGVLFLAISYGQVPWIALTLAVTFGIYGLLRKQARGVDSLLGLTVESCLLAPLALGFLIFGGGGVQGHFPAGAPMHQLLLPLSGVVTSVPLLLFAAAARRLRLATIGFLQYITPSFHLLLAVWLFDEPFTVPHLITFACIWSGLILYSVDAVRSTGAVRSFTGVGQA